MENDSPVTFKAEMTCAKCSEPARIHRTLCRKCEELKRRKRSGQRARESRKMLVDDKYFTGPYGKYIERLFARERA